jgi:hypothetical protein
MTRPYKTQGLNIRDDIIDIAWSPKINGGSMSDAKEKFYVLTKNGLVEEQSFTEFKKFTCGLSAHGHLCMSGA